MGYQGNGFALVSMTNKDVYYVKASIAKELMALIEKHEQPEFFVVTDVKSGATVAIATANISSVVTKEGSTHAA